MEVTSKKIYEEPSDSRPRHTGLFPGACQTLCLLFIHPRAPNLISLRSARTMPA